METNTEEEKIQYLIDQISLDYTHPNPHYTKHTIDAEPAIIITLSNSDSGQPIASERIKVKTLLRLLS